MPPERNSNSKGNQGRELNRPARTGFWDRLRNMPVTRLAWLWLLIGFGLLPFNFFNMTIPLAVWLAPVFLLRYTRTVRRTGIALSLIFFSYAVSISIAVYSGESTSPALSILGIILFPLIRGVAYTLPYALDRLIGPRLGPWARLLVFPLAFTSIDWLMSLGKIINSTGSLAYSQTENLALVQILSITGMWGITFLIMWFASTVNALWENAFDWRPVRSILGTFMGVLLAVFLFGSVRLTFFAPSSPSVTAATITLDDSISKHASSGIDWTTFYTATDAQRAAVRPQFEASVNQLLARTETALRGGAKIVGWQEGAGPVLEEDERSTLDRVAALARQYDAYIEVSFGLVTRADVQHFVRNQSILVDNTGNILWTYNKTYPVFPSETYVVPAGDGKLPLADTPYGRLSTAICNDFHFPILIRQAGENGVYVVIAPYNDLHPFELADEATSMVRTIENGFSLVRAAGHGPSTIMDYEGRTLAYQNYYTNSSGIMLTTVPTHGVTTIYSRIGDVFAYLCVAGLAFLVVWAFLHRKQPAPIPQNESK